ncbi:MAG TPA: allantoate amidohydrolase [Candidatus Aquilonibacter sp.]|nr:allantoate amidohydrolase [Candidatus Aquilonibacter sp.]
MDQAARRIIDRCRELAAISDVEGETTRLFLSPATRQAHALVLGWMNEAGLATRVDDIGNVRGFRAASEPDASTLLLFSHIDTVRNAGAFDGPLGVVLGIEVVAALGERRLPFNIEIIAFSEEEGVRFGFPFLSSLAATGQLAHTQLDLVDAEGIAVADALRNFGLTPEAIAQTAALPPDSFAALEVHIEQGPVLEAANESLAVVEGIVGQSRLRFTFEGHANHAGTTPMALRKDALAAAAQWITEVERYAADNAPLVATVGHVEILPGAVNVIPGRVVASLDIRHPDDNARRSAVTHLQDFAKQVATQRGVSLLSELTSEQNTIQMDGPLTNKLLHAAQGGAEPVGAMYSGAGHDAMIVAPHVPTTMLFLRSPGGVSHHPTETVREQDVSAALRAVLTFIAELEREVTAR